MKRIISFGLFLAFFGEASFTIFWHYSDSNSLYSALATYQFIAENSTTSPSSSDVNDNSSTQITQSGNATTNGTLLYEFPGIGLKIEYPSNWEKVEYGRAMKAFGEGVIANLLSPLDGSSDKFRDYVLLKVENLSSSDLSKGPANNSIAGGATYQQVLITLILPTNQISSPLCKSGLLRMVKRLLWNSQSKKTNLPTICL